MKKTKIICSIGPVSYPKDVMREMIKSGMNVARINFSHATLEERKQVEDLVNYFNTEENCNIGILYDTKGPDLRTCDFENGAITLENGETVRIVREDVLGTKDVISFNHKPALDNVQVGTIILLEDGLVKLEVISKEEDGVTCKIINGATIKNKRGVNIPGVDLKMPFISNLDLEDIKYACEHNGDFLAASFVSSAKDVEEIKSLMNKCGNKCMQIISKIETATAIENLDEIIEASDGIMVARGDLGVEVSMKKLPILQKMIVQKCREKGKFCIIATEMLASMYTNGRPTRAEVSDISNAVIDGADAVMLSGETTIGKYPIDAVKYMADICEFTEENVDFDNAFCIDMNHDMASIISKSAVESANLMESKLIVTSTISGKTARIISNIKPNSPILAAVKDKKIATSLTLNWGVYPVIISKYDTTDIFVKTLIEESKKFTELNKGDSIVITGGFHTNGYEGTTDFLKLERI